MGNDDWDIFYKLDELITNFGKLYEELVDYAGNSEILDASIEAYIKTIYKEKIADLCNVDENLVTDDIIRIIQSGKEDDSMISGGRFTMFRKPYTVDEAKEVVKGILAGNNYLPKKKEIIKEENLVEPVVEEKKEETTSPEEVVKVETEINENVIDNSSKEEVAVEEKNVPAAANVVVSEDNNDSKMAEVEKQVKKLYEEYYKSSEQNEEKLNEIRTKENRLYKEALSQLTGINQEDIKDFVVFQVSNGISDTKIDENGNTVNIRRPLDDEEAKLIVEYTNNMTEEEVENLINQ